MPARSGHSSEPTEIGAARIDAGHRYGTFLAHGVPSAEHRLNKGSGTTKGGFVVHEELGVEVLGLASSPAKVKVDPVALSDMADGVWLCASVEKLCERGEVLEADVLFAERMNKH